jgi:hypothetical protein
MNLRYLRWVIVILVVFCGSAAATLKVTQRVLLDGPSADSTQVLGIEETGKLPRLRFSDFTESKVQFIELGKSDPDFPRPLGGCSATDTFMRFKQRKRPVNRIFPGGGCCETMGRRNGRIVGGTGGWKCSRLARGSLARGDQIM